MLVKTTKLGKLTGLTIEIYKHFSNSRYEFEWEAIIWLDDTYILAQAVESTRSKAVAVAERELKRKLADKLVYTDI